MTEAAHARLREMILSGTLSPGAQLLEGELTEMLGMSRTPLRPALARLEAEGLIAIRPRHGIRVRAISARDAREVFEVLTGLEGMAAWLVAARGLPPEEFAPLVEAVEAMEAALAAGELEAWSQADERFHAALLELCGNARLIAIARSHRDQVRRVRRATLRLRPAPDASTRQHRAMLEAVLRGDAPAAREIHQRHRDEYGRVLFALLADFGLQE
jgi:DNA-binding GntR family transcriptional regulator